jgi:hypothetical protein
MPDLTAIAQALGALKGLKDIAQGIVAAHDIAAFRERQIEFQGKIIDAQDAISAIQEERATLLETIRQLEKQVAEFETWESEKQRYELKDIAGGHGSLTYMIKLTMQGSEPVHCICANCYQHHKKFYLQKMGLVAADSRKLICPNCKNAIIFDWWPPRGYPGSPAPALPG